MSRLLPVCGLAFVLAASGPARATLIVCDKAVRIDLARSVASRVAMALSRILGSSLSIIFLSR